MSDLKMLLGLSKSPVAVAFLNSPPQGVSKWEGGETPAGCSFWKAAQDGKTFYTVPSDHFNCAVGAYTHKITLPESRTAELMDTVGFMVEKGYIAMEEVPGIPTLETSPNVIAYGPAENVPFDPDIVIVTANPAQAMLIYEAAIKAGAATGLVNTLGRPGCAALPLTAKTGMASISLGCKGNRTFTGLPDDEMYVTIPGSKWSDVVEQIASICVANSDMGDHYLQHQAAFSSAN